MVKIEIVSLGVTTETEGGVALVMLEDDMPPDCVAVFVKRGEQYEALLELIRKSQ
jgi:hypothetical protein